MEKLNSRIVATAHNPKPWVIVSNPGTDDEDIVIDFTSFDKAAKWKKDNQSEWEETLDILRRLDNGCLTAEY